MQDHAQTANYELSAQQFAHFRQLVREHSGIALRPEKHQLVCSRVARRLRALSLSSFDEYLALLARQGPHGEELEQLLNAITTNKTSFFREAHHFEELQKHVVQPKLRETDAPRLRVWSAGCSTGEEPYSIVATLLAATPRWEHADIAVLASDLDTNVLAVGERGVYSLEKLEELPAAIAERWFIRGTGDKAGLIRARRELRQRIAFRRINFIEPDWPVRTRFDAIFCRNALIYFDPPVQREIVSRLLAYLAPGGMLFLGHSESMAGVRPDLRSLGRTSYLYLGGAE
ncbi:MAG TPA: CheR family methyltransferase [Polyangiales bacterium]